MTVTAPPRPPRSNDPVDHEEFEALVEALIEEARQRARRRRRMYGAVAAVVALVGVAVFAGFERTAQSQSASPALAAPSSLAAGADGSKIAFIYNVPGAQPFVGEPFQDWDLYVMNADGSGKRSLTRHAGIQIDTRAWSPDGRKIVFIRSREGSLSGHISVMNSDGSGQRKLTGDSPWLAAPTWSPDGRKIAFMKGNLAGWSVYVMNADGSATRRLTRNASIPGWGLVAQWGPGLAWSPDGRTIAFTSDRDGNVEVYVMNADGSGQKRLTRKPADDQFGAWSPDGRTIAFTSDRDGNVEVYVMNADGSGQQRLTRNPGEDATPAWSPDGRKIAFRSARDGNSEIHVMNADGSGQRRLTRIAWPDVTPAWSPDGRMIAFSFTDIYVMNADGSGRRNLTRTPEARELGFAWSPALRPKG